MLPYIAPPVWKLGPVEIHAFGLCAAAAILAGTWVIVRRCGGLGGTAGTAQAATFWMVVSGFAGAHLFKLLYLPDAGGRILADPMLVFDLFNGIASFGGFLGATAGGLAYLYRRKVPLASRWQYADAVGYALPFAWTLARLGCAFAHDHPGVRSDGWLAVRFPEGSRYDLGLLEAGFSAAIAILFLVLSRRGRVRGFYLGLFFSLYGPFRFLLDRLHESPPRYGAWTLDQYGAAASTLAGVTIVIGSAAGNCRLSVPGCPVVPEPEPRTPCSARRGQRPNAA